MTMEICVLHRENGGLVWSFRVTLMQCRTWAGTPRESLSSLSDQTKPLDSLHPGREKDAHRFKQLSALQPIDFWLIKRCQFIFIWWRLINSFCVFRLLGTRSRGRRFTALTCSVWLWWAVFSLCPVLTRRSCGCSRLHGISWRTWLTYHAPLWRNCWAVM